MRAFCASIAILFPTMLYKSCMVIILQLCNLTFLTSRLKICHIRQHWPPDWSAYWQTSSGSTGSSHSVYRQHSLFRKANLNELRINALRNIFSLFTFQQKGEQTVATPFTVCKYTKFLFTTKQNVRIIAKLLQKKISILPTPPPFSVNPPRINQSNLLISYLSSAADNA